MDRPASTGWSRGCRRRGRRSHRAPALRGPTPPPPSTVAVRSGRPPDRSLLSPNQDTQTLLDIHVTVLHCFVAGLRLRPFAEVHPARRKCRAQARREASVFTASKRETGRTVELRMRSGSTVDERFDRWMAALETRHLADLTVREVARALRALSSAYVERRHTLAAGAALGGAGKRAAFA